MYMEAPNHFPQTPKVPEASALTNNDVVEDGLRNLGNDAFSLYTALNSPIPYPQESFERWIDSFNSLPPEERSRGVYDNTQILDARKSVSRDVQTPSGYLYTIHRDEQGEVTLSSRMVQ
jgi:hypothetical protein